MASVLLQAIFPWNDRDSSNRLKYRFSNMWQLFEFIADDTNQGEMQRRFWENVTAFFQDPHNAFRQEIDELIYMDVGVTTKGAIYSRLKQDAAFLLEYGSLILNKPHKLEQLEQARHFMEGKYQRSFADLPLTEGFYLLCRAAGAQEFAEVAKRVVISL
jgi:hypothetical protein